MPYQQESLFDPLLNISEVADTLGVSSATVRNWIKAKHLIPVSSERRIAFHLADVNDLKVKIESGEFARLSSRMCRVPR